MSQKSRNHRISNRLVRQQRHQAANGQSTQQSELKVLAAIAKVIPRGKPLRHRHHQQQQQG